MLLDQYHDTVESHLTKIIGVIHESLYELFARPQFDLDKATASYGDLLQKLGISRGTTHWVYATTNYDPVAELTLERLGYEMDWGEKQQAIGGSAPSALPASSTALRERGRSFISTGASAGFAALTPTGLPRRMPQPLRATNRATEHRS